MVGGQRFLPYFFNQVKDFWIRNLFSTNVKYLLRLQGGHNLRTAALLGNTEALPDPRSKVLILSPFATSYDKDYEIKNWSIEVDEPKEPNRLEIERRIAELSTIIIARPKLSISSLLATSYNQDYGMKNLSPEKTNQKNETAWKSSDERRSYRRQKASLSLGWKCCLRDPEIKIWCSLCEVWRKNTNREDETAWKLNVEC